MPSQHFSKINDSLVFMRFTRLFACFLSPKLSGTINEHHDFRLLWGTTGHKEKNEKLLGTA